MNLQQNKAKKCFNNMDSEGLQKTQLNTMFGWLAIL